MDEPVSSWMLWWVYGINMLGLAGVGLGILSAAAPQRSIALYQWLMAWCNWRVSPIDERRELRNTRWLGIVLILLSLGALWSWYAKRPDG